MNAENTGETFLALTLTHRSPPTPSFLFSTFLLSSKVQISANSSNEINILNFLSWIEKWCLYFRHFYLSIFLHFDILFFEVSIFYIFTFRHYYRSIFLSFDIFLVNFFDIFIVRHFFSIKLGLTKYICGLFFHPKIHS